MAVHVPRVCPARQVAGAPSPCHKAVAWLLVTPQLNVRQPCRRQQPRTRLGSITKFSSNSRGLSPSTWPAQPRRQGNKASRSCRGMGVRSAAAGAQIVPKRPPLPCSRCRGALAVQLPSQHEGSVARTAEPWLVVIAFVPRPRHKYARRVEACNRGCRRLSDGYEAWAGRGVTTRAEPE